MSDGLRIAHLQPMTLDFYGHDETELGTRVRYSVTNLAAAQVRLGDRPTVHLLSSRGLRAFRGGAYGVRVDGWEGRFHPCVEPPRSVGQSRRFARQLSASMLRAIDPTAADLVHFHGARQFHLMYGAIARRARAVGLPLVAQDRGARQAWRLERWAQRHGLEGSDAVCAASTEAMDAFAAMGIPADRLHLVPNAVDPDVFNAGSDGRDRPGEPLRIVSVARLVEMKDPLTMARGMVELHRRGRALEVTVLGPGELRPQVEAILREGGVPATFVRHLSQPELAERYRASDLFVITTAWAGEGWTQTPLEAMACGVPVIATDVTGISDVVGDAAVKVPVRDPVALADAAERLVDDRAAWRRHRELGLRRARGFTWDAVARQLRGIYEDVLR